MYSTVCHSSYLYHSVTKLHAKTDKKLDTHTDSFLLWDCKREDLNNQTCIHKIDSKPFVLCPAANVHCLRQELHASRVQHDDVEAAVQRKGEARPGVFALQRVFK